MAASERSRAVRMDPAVPRRRLSCPTAFSLRRLGVTIMDDVSLVRDLSATEAGRERELTARADAQARAALACERQPSTPAFAAPVARASAFSAVQPQPQPQPQQPQPPMAHCFSVQNAQAPLWSAAGAWGFGAAPQQPPPPPPQHGFAIPYSPPLGYMPAFPQHGTAAWSGGVASESALPAHPAMVPERRRVATEAEGLRLHLITRGGRFQAARYTNGGRQVIGNFDTADEAAVAYAWAVAAEQGDAEQVWPGLQGDASGGATPRAANKRDREPSTAAAPPPSPFAAPQPAGPPAAPPPPAVAAPAPPPAPVPAPAGGVGASYEAGDEVYEAGDEVWYYDRGVGWTPCGVAAVHRTVHRNDVAPYYTISHKGRRRETEAQFMQPPPLHPHPPGHTRLPRPATLASLPRRPPLTSPPLPPPTFQASLLQRQGVVWCDASRLRPRLPGQPPPPHLLPSDAPAPAAAEHHSTAEEESPLSAQPPPAAPAPPPPLSVLPTALQPPPPFSVLPTALQPPPPFSVLPTALQPPRLDLHPARPSLYNFFMKDEVARLKAAKHAHTHTPLTHAHRALHFSMPWGSCRLDVETRGLAFPLPRHLVCVEKFTLPYLSLP